MMKVIHNLIVTSLTSASAEKLHLRVLKNSAREYARKMLARYENFTFECKCELALNLYHSSYLAATYIAINTQGNTIVSIILEISKCITSKIKSRKILLK